MLLLLLILYSILHFFLLKLKLIFYYIIIYFIIFFNCWHVVGILIFNNVHKNNFKVKKEALKLKIIKKNLYYKKKNAIEECDTVNRHNVSSTNQSLNTITLDILTSPDKHIFLC